MYVWDTLAALTSFISAFMIGIIEERMVALSRMNFKAVKAAAFVCECSLFLCNFNVGGISQYHVALFCGMLTSQVVFRLHYPLNL